MWATSEQRVGVGCQAGIVKRVGFCTKYIAFRRGGQFSCGFIEQREERDGRMIITNHV